MEQICPHVHTASVSPHVKSSMLMGSLKSMWRAMKSPAFDFQGDPLQQGGTLIVGPGDPHIQYQQHQHLIQHIAVKVSVSSCLIDQSQKQTMFFFSLHFVLLMNIQVPRSILHILIVIDWTICPSTGYCSWLDCRQRISEGVQRSLIFN